MDVSNSISSSNTLKFDDVIGVILSKEMQQRKSTGETSCNVLTVENRGRKKERGKSIGKCGNSRKGRYKSKHGKIECWNCGKKGHLKKDCRSLKKQRDRQQDKN
jgi:hypothetical protein